MNDNTPEINTLTDYVRHIGSMWEGMTAGHPMTAYRLEPFVLRHASPEVRGNPLPPTINPGTPKECFSNAGQHALFSEDLTYCEGFAMRSDLAIPIHHAWVVDSEGRVIDTTWNDPQNCTYLGVEFSTKFLSKWVFKNKYWGLLASSWSINHAVMKDFELLKSGGKWRAK